MIKAILYGLVLVLILTAVGHAQGAVLAQGMDAYRRAKFKDAITILRSIDVETLSPDARILVHQYLALSLLALREREDSREEFMKILEINPDYRLDGGQFPPPAVELFKKASLDQADKWCHSGASKYDEGDLDRAIHLMELALRLNPEHPVARDLLKLYAKERAAQAKEAKPPEPPCVPSRTWGELDARIADCDGVDYTSKLSLPADANRLTLLYNKHHFGVGKCWKLILYDSGGKELFTFDDPEGIFAGEQQPEGASRWRTIDLPSVVTISKIVMHAEGGHKLQRHLGRRVGREFADEFILGFEVVCPTTTQTPAEEADR